LVDRRRWSARVPLLAQFRQNLLPSRNT
jgi:hypothetical protein